MFREKKRLFSFITVLFILLTGCSPTAPNVQVVQDTQVVQNEIQTPNVEQKDAVAYVQELAQEEPVAVPQTLGEPVDIHFVDTGNSDSILISDNGKYMIIDGADNNDEQMLVEYLNKLNIKKVDYVVLTHPDADHCGGLDAIIENFEIGQVFVGNGDADTKTYKDFVQVAIDKNLEPSVPLVDKTFTLGSGTFKLYNQTSRHADVNDNSLVALYTIGSNKFLFTGDSGKEVEAALPLDEIGKIDVLKVGHHGSKTSSSDSFVKTITPRYSVITTGSDNKYGHPHQETLDTLTKYKSKVYRTDIDGTIVFTSDGKSLQMESTKVPVKTISDQPISAAVINPNINVTSNQDADSDVAISIPIDDTVDISKTVYITNSGDKYHADGCRYLKKSKIQFTLEEAQSQGYEPCKVCKP